MIIREIYEHENAHEDFELELEKALEEEVRTIVIEPSKLGDETSRWISVGNCLHKTSVLAGLGSIIAHFTWPERGMVMLPLGFVSVVCAGVYAVSWQFDPCCKYQVESDARKLQRLPLLNLTSSTPVVLVRRDDTRRKFLQNTICLIATSLCGWKIYQWYIE